jgi:hypothetical protein
MNDGPKSKVASYFGLRVEVLTRMDNWSLIVYDGRKVLVETADLRESELSIWTPSTWNSHGLAPAA